MPRLGTVTLLFAMLAHPVLADSGLSVSRQSLGKAVERVERKDPDMANHIKHAYRSQQPMFIFVPGILGSKIVCDGKVIWGAKNFDDGMNRDLVYKPVRCASHFLDNFRIFGYKQDVYGQMRDLFESMNLSDVKHFTAFPYDWRQDLRTTAEQFNNFVGSESLARDLKDREVVLVAHSMGGLVATWWYNKFYRGHETAYPFRKISKVVFLGTPHSGAPSSVIALARGYLPAEPGGIEKLVYSRFFKDLNTACFTFPSIYQVFPLESVIFEKSPLGKPSEADSFSVTPWRRYGWAEKTRRLLEQGKDEFYGSLKSLLENGKQFQTELQSFPPIPDAVYVYSDKFKTATRLVVSGSEKDGWKFTPEYPEMSGDGRVPTLVAQNAGKINNPDLLRFASLEHGALMNDESFLRYMRLIRELSMQAADNQFLSIALNEPAVINAMASEGALLPVPLSLHDRETESAKTLVAFNRQIIASRLQKLGFRGDPTLVVYQLARKRDKDGSDEAPYLYSLFLGMDNQSGLAYHAANNLGYELIRAGRPDVAVDNLELATRLKPIATEEQSKEESLAKTYNNLGLAYMATGRYTDAVKAFQASLEFNKSPKTAANLYSAKSGARSNGLYN